VKRFLISFLVAPALLQANEKLDVIGTWDGKEESAELAGSYEDPAQADLKFPVTSFVRAPWRAYMDTWPASKFLDGLGYNCQLDPKEMDSVVGLLKDAGFSSARYEVNWGSFMTYDSDEPNPNTVQKLTEAFQIFKKHGVRPIILLNANSGDPVPSIGVKTQLLQPAAVGDRRIQLADTSAIKLHYTGLRAQGRPYMAWPLITSIGEDGWVELSAPLKKAVPAGEILLATLKYRPLGEPKFKDGTANTGLQDTLDGWNKYIAAVTNAARAAMDSGDSNDSGFDLEVWNEHTFGSEFLHEKHYYEPPRAFGWKPITYENHGRKAEGTEVFLPMTVDHVNNPASGLRGVKVISGFANQRPSDSGTSMWPGQGGFSRHYYTHIDPQDKMIEPGRFNAANIGLIDKNGNFVGQRPPSREPWIVEPGSYTIPPHNVSCPEFWFFAYKCEFIVRDLQPFPGPYVGHHRFSHPGDGNAADVWMTEFNIFRGEYAKWLAKETKLDPARDPKIKALMHTLATKGTLRTYVFMPHKGLKTISMYAPKGNDHELNMLPEKFFSSLKASNYELTETVLAETGPQITVIKRVTDLFKNAEPIEIARPLTVEKIVEYQPRIVYKDQGTPELPHRFHRDDLAILPFQLEAGKFAIGCYIVTRNIAHAWDKSKELVDPARYEMPPQDFDITLSNIRGKGCEASLYDPILNASSPVKVLEGSDDALTVRIAVVDYPRFLIVKESQPGPLIRSPRLATNENGSATLTFSLDRPEAAKVSTGTFPDRTSLGVTVVPSSKDMRFDIPALPEQSGVRVEVNENGLIARWPLWEHDVAGVHWPRILPLAVAKPATGEPSTVSLLPTLPKVEPPMDFSVGVPASDVGEWKQQGSNWRAVVSSAQGKAEVEAFVHPSSYNEIPASLPTLSLSDRATARQDVWQGLPCAVLDLKLDPTAHPGEPFCFRRYWLLPMRYGTFVFSTKANTEALLEDARVEGFRSTIQFKKP